MTDPADELPHQFWMNSHLDRLRQQHAADSQRMVETLMEITDDVESLVNVPSFSELPRDWQDGLKILNSRIQNAMADWGVEPVPATGRVNPLWHRVVECVEAPGDPETILRVVRTGYLMGDRVLRPAEVVTIQSHP